MMYHGVLTLTFIHSRLRQTRIYIAYLNIFDAGPNHGSLVEDRCCARIHCMRVASE